MIFISSKISDGDMRLLENRRKIFKKLGFKNVFQVKQVHGNQIILVNEAPNALIEADGLVTNNPTLYLMIKVADCMAISFYDPIQNAVGLIHVGYKGLENGIIKNALR